MNLMEVKTKFTEKVSKKDGFFIIASILITILALKGNLHSAVVFILKYVKKL